MKNFTPVLPTARHLLALSIAIATPLANIRAQVAPSNQSASDSAALAESASNVVKITGPLPDGSPPPLSPPPPKLMFQPNDVIATRVAKVGQRQIIFQRVAPIALPPIPEPAPTPAPEDPEIQARLQTVRERYKDTQLVFVGAGVYRSKDHPHEPRTFLRLWPTAKSDPIALWSSADWELLSGFASYEGADGQPYALLMAISVTDVARQADINKRFGRAEGAPAMPDFSQEKTASFVVVGGQEDHATLAPIRALHELYNNEKERLKAALDGREKAAEEQAALLKADPPENKNIVLRYWRVDRAGQNGAKPKPADIR